MNFEKLEKLDVKNYYRQDAVIVCFGKFDGLEEVHAVDVKLYSTIPGHIGSHYGHEINRDDTDGRFFTYGSNAEELFKVMKPLLVGFEFLNNAHVYLEFTENNKLISEIDFKLHQ